MCSAGDGLGVVCREAGVGRREGCLAHFVTIVKQVQTCAPNMLFFMWEGMQEQDKACSLRAHGDHAPL